MGFIGRAQKRPKWSSVGSGMVIIISSSLGVSALEHIMLEQHDAFDNWSFEFES